MTVSVGRKRPEVRPIERQKRILIPPERGVRKEALPKRALRPALA